MCVRVSEFPQGSGDMEHVARIMLSMEVVEIDMPHVVVTTVSGCASASYSGPYANGLAALAVAEAEHQAELAAGGTGEIRFSVAALYPGAELHELREPAAAYADPDTSADCG
jgi:hypothetical protein